MSSNTNDNKKGVFLPQGLTEEQVKSLIAEAVAKVEISKTNDILEKLTNVIENTNLNANVNSNQAVTESENAKQIRAKMLEKVQTVNEIFKQDVQAGKLKGMWRGQEVYTAPIILEQRADNELVLFPVRLVYSYKGALVTYIWRKYGDVEYVHGIHAENVENYLRTYNRKKTSNIGSIVEQTMLPNRQVVPGNVDEFGNPAQGLNYNTLYNGVK